MVYTVLKVKEIFRRKNAPEIDTIEYLKFIVSNRKEESISI